MQTIGFFELSTRIVHRHREFLAIVGGRFEHGFGHDRFDNRTESARTEFVFHRAIDHIVEHLGLEGEFDPIEREEFGVLLRDGVFRLGEDVAQGFAIEGIQVSEYRQTANDFGNQAEGFEILRFDVLHEVGSVDLLLFCTES